RLLDLAGDAIEQLALLARHLAADAEDPARGARDRRAVLDQILAAALTLLVGQRLQQVADQPQRVLEEALRGTALEPALELAVRLAPRLDAADARHLEDALALRVADAAVDPGDVQQRHEVHQRDGVARVAQLLELPQDLLVGDAGALGELLTLLLAARALAHLLDQLALAALEVLRLVGPPPVLPDVSLGHS